MSTQNVPKELEEAIVELLATIYKRANWRQIAKGRDPIDVFQHRVLVAAYQPDLKRFIEKLCRGLSIQGVRIDPQLLAKLRENEELVMEELRNSSVYYVALAYKRAKEVKA